MLHGASNSPLTLLHNLAGQVLTRADALPVADLDAIREDAAAQLFGKRFAKFNKAHSNPNEGAHIAIVRTK
jgi:hypothetical protein